MKLLLIVETPDDDALHYTRVNEALRRYIARVEANNRDPFNACDHFGMTKGPNSAVLVLVEGDRVKITEVRVDSAPWIVCALDTLPRWLRWTLRWALPA